MLAQPPAVSVIMPVYNAAPFIAPAVRSVFAQTFKNWELIIVDDGSTDDSRAIAEKICGGDPRVTILSIPPSGGPAHPRNVALDRAQGRYIAFLDADDIWLPKKLERQVGFMDENNIAISHAAYRCFSADGKTLGRLYHPAPVVDRNYHIRRRNLGMNAVIDRSITGPFHFDEKAPVEDFDLFLRLSKHHKIYGLDEELYLYRRGHPSVSSGGLRMLFNTARSIAYSRHEIGVMRAAFNAVRFGMDFVTRRVERLLERRSGAAPQAPQISSFTLPPP